MDKEITLKPCPFCGKEASPNGVIRRASSPDCRWADGTECREAFYCNCMSCGANNGGIVGGYQTRDKAVSHWNTRAVLAEQKRREAHEATSEVAQKIGNQMLQNLRRNVSEERKKEPQMTAAERDAFTRAQQEFDNGETVDDDMKQIATGKFYGTGGIGNGVYAAREALAQQQCRQAPQPQMTAAERDAFTRARQEFDDGETVPAPADDVVQRMRDAVTGMRGMAAALAVAREGWVPASELSSILPCGHRKRFESGGHTPVCQMCRAEKAEQQLGTMYSLDDALGNLTAEERRAAGAAYLAFNGVFPKDYQEILQFTLKNFIATRRAHLTAKQQTERVTVQYVSAADTFGWKVFLDHCENGLFTCAADAERYAAALRAELAALGKGGK